MGKWNNFKHLKRNFGLVIINLIVLIFGFMYVPVSSLVMLSTIPAVIYSFYSKRWSLIVVVVAVYAALLLIFMATVMNPASVIELGQNLNILFHLYLAIYPYEINVSIVSLLGFELMFYLTLFIFTVLLVSVIMKKSEFTTMITFSLGVLMFSAVYLMINVFSFVFPQLEYYMVNNIAFQYIFAFFYIILPFLTLNLTLLYLELVILDWRKRQDYEIEAKKLNSSKQKISLIILGKILFVIMIVLFAIIFIGGIIA